MGKDTKISWAEHSFNPWIGCTKVSPGCDFCYAEAYDKRVGGHTWGTGAKRRRTTPANWRDPLKWDAEAHAKGEVARVFCLSLGDVMDPEAPEGAREDLWKLIDKTPFLLWLLLTKRPQLYDRFLPAEGFLFDNVMLGATTEDQYHFDMRMTPLRIAAGALTARNMRRRFTYPGRQVQTFVSYEPALGPIKMGPVRPDWLIFGGETGAGRRPMDLTWAQAIRAQCEQYGVAFWMKQMSAPTPDAAAALIPVDMLIRQRPEGSTK